MQNWIAGILLIAIVAFVAVLAFTGLSFFTDQHLEGSMLKVHMMASGALVVALPVFAICYLARSIDKSRSGGLQRFGYWLLIVSGLVAILTMFLCMLPYPSTEQMRQLVEIHGYAGFAMVPALLLLIAGMASTRRIHSTRSATPG
jgi:hypothetical protein